MKKEKKNIVTLAELFDATPERALLELNKQLIIAICLFIMGTILSIFMKSWFYILIVVVMFLFYLLLYAYQLYLFYSGKIIEIYGICTDTGKDTFPLNRPYILVSVEDSEETYKVVMNNKKKTVKESNEVLMYVRKETIMKQEAYTQINNPLMFFVIKL